MIIKKLLTSLLFYTCVYSNAQEKSMIIAIEDTMPVNQKITGAFKSTRVINAHSIEMLAKGNMDVRIMHRFGVMQNGLQDLFGLDIATMRLGFDFGITNNFTVGIGRSTFRKEIDAFTKFRLLQQTKGIKEMPVSLIVALGYLVTAEPYFDGKTHSFYDRSANYVQVIVGRKFSNKFSFQLSPIVVNSNTPVNPTDDKTIFAIGGGARFKISKRMALTFDYHHPFGNLDASHTDPISFGIDIETGGHVFQLQFSNATGMNERAYITQTTGKFGGGLRFGFNLSRIFNIAKRK